jgi:hypothetical protein
MESGKAAIYRVPDPDFCRFMGMDLDFIVGVTSLYSLGRARVGDETGPVS